MTRKLATPLSLEADIPSSPRPRPFPIVQIDTPLILLAMRRSGKVKISFWDALILEVALIAGVTVFYSEDFHDGAMEHVVGSL